MCLNEFHTRIQTIVRPLLYYFYLFTIKVTKAKVFREKSQNRSSFGSDRFGDSVLNKTFVLPTTMFNRKPHVILCRIFYYEVFHTISRNLIWACSVPYHSSSIQI